MIHNSNIILGIDPGYGRVGYGVIQMSANNPLFAVAACIETLKTDAPSDRIHTIYKQLEAVIVKERPDTIALESLFFAKNTKTALRVAEMRGVLLFLSKEHNIPVREFTPLQVKMAVCGYGRAEKKQVQYMVTKLLNLPSPPQPDDTADALAIALTAAFTRLPNAG